ncbi:SDR family oxidoreductase [Geodermatophilus sp. DF01-2]|uniref:SDR family NAD(P)-dependent oxidoreductase n=1 Tax=Geodermatophilus sp. DF01-2 TaxID=2559610 RepID=UPI00107485CB|nr:SDR family NAD(P)-dependent oxidoreductase [Geodermatophilus sp. DF01_2]TFV64752.1 SDR family oxidoreductase [Geodermatophilus sp. DF01_2]
MAESPRPLAGRTALITGAGRNIGRAMARELAAAGADIVVNVRQNLAEGEQTADEVRALGSKAVVVAGDVSKVEDVRAVFDQATAALGPVHILVNNAAVRPHQPFLEISPEDWNWVLGIGLTGAFHCAQAAIPGMVEAGWGRVINISGRDGFSGILNRAHGVTVKAGIHGFTKALALEFGPSGITVNTVVPGLIHTTRPKEWYPTLSYEERSKGIPVRHPGSVEDIARTVRFLVAEGEYITGQAVHVNGGEFLVT